MDPITMALVGKAAIGVTQGLAGAFMQAKRPKYKIPKSEREALALAKLRAADPNMPGEQRAIDKAMLAEANAVRAAQDSGNAMEVIPAISAGTQGNLADIAAQSAQFQNNDLNGLDAALSRNAAYQDQAFQMNEYAPYAQRYELKQQLLGAGVTNVMGALDSYAAKSFVTPQTSNQYGSTASGNYPGSGMVNFAQFGAQAANAYKGWVPQTLPLLGIKPFQR